MDKMTFASYKFKPSDVIDGLNRYFADTKANRYFRVSLKIKNGEVKPGNYYVLRDIVFDVNVPKVKELGYYYLICDPEEAVGVAINWLREEHDIFYTPGMDVPEAAKEYEKATRKDRISDILCTIEELQKNLHEAKRRAVALEAGHAEKSKIIDRQVAKIKELEESIAEKDIHIEGLEADRCLSNRIVKEQREFITKVAELLETRDPYIEREYTAAINALSNIVRHPNRYKWLYESLKDNVGSVLQEAEEKED